MSRCPDQVVNLKRDTECLSPQACLVLIYRPTAPPSRKSSREVGGRGREVESPNHPQGALPQNWDETEQNRTVTCMVLQAKANDRRKILALHRDEFHRP
ncbi:hypothetical protein TNCV_4028251 [Trichonephila clavipes]|nr:hypothetical protein TNCV_4028251 [Trichonephila clavipes]